MSKWNDSMSLPGPMASASLGIQQLGENLYFSYLLDESVRRFAELQDEYEKALKTNNKDAISQTKFEIEVYEGIFNLTLSYNFDELES